MKKITFLITTSLFLLIGCSLGSIKNTKQDIAWKVIGELPAQKGYNKNIGVAGVLYGTLNDRYILVGGGANFPYKSVLEGGKKESYSDIYLLDIKDDKINMIEHANLPYKIAYGASVTTENGIYYVGGSEKDNEILFFSLKDKKLEMKKIGELPFKFQSGAVVEKENKLYIVAGKQNGKLSTKFYSYDLKTEKINELASFPGEERAQVVSQILGDELYVFSGGNKKAFVDGYKYNFKTNSWTKVAPVIINGEEISLLGGNSVKLNKNEMLVIGGFNKEIWDNANYYLGNLKGEKLAEYRKNYFNMNPIDFKWNNKILIYNSEKNSWKTIGEIPFNAPCGAGLVLIKNRLYSINGEIKPGVRINKIYEGYIR